MKALLIGGTGTISASITELLVEKGWEVTLLNRGNRELPKGAEQLVADIYNEQDVRSKLAGRRFDVVADFLSYVTEDIQRNIRLFSGITDQYIFISSASAYQKPLAGLPITESTPLYNPYWQYSRDKIACEDVLISHYRSTGWPVTIVRPSHTYDKSSIPMPLHGNNGSWQVLQRMQKGKPVIVHGDGSSLWTLTHSRDFAKGFTGLMGNVHAIGEAVHITSDEILTWNDIFRLYASALKVSFEPVYIPSSLLAKAGAKMGYDFEGALLGDKANSVLFDNSKLKRLVPDYVATTRFDTGAKEIVQYHLTHTESQIPDEDFECFCDSMIETMTQAQLSACGND